MIKVVLPQHLRTLIGADHVLQLDVDGIATLSQVIDDLETLYPVLKGTLRDPASRQRRPFIRFFACQEDLSLEPMDRALPTVVCLGQEPLLVIGAMAGG